jgi:hypothetical protein
MNQKKPLDLTNAPATLRERFWSKVDIRTIDECWEWQAHRKRSGYGQFTVAKGDFHVASRVSAALREPVPAGTHVCHTCDNPPCVNPAHLFVGTPSENILDSVSKGRANRARGVDHPDSRLTERDVKYIRTLPRRYGLIAELARRFGVSDTAIRRVRAGITWRHV